VSFDTGVFAGLALLLLGALQALPVRARGGVLAVAGVVFGASWSPAFAVVALLTAGAVHGLTIRLAATPVEGRRGLLAAAVAVSVASVVVSRYATAIEGGWWSGLGAFAAGSSTWPVVAPLLATLFAMQCAAYTLDVARGRTGPARSFIDLVGVLLLVPTLVAGPMGRVGELLPGVSQPRVLEPARVVPALLLLVWAVAKKELLADNLSPFVEPVLADPSAHNRWICAAAVQGVALHTYLVVSAWTDVARGLAGLSGIEVGREFERPWLAVSLSEFWRRSNITVGRWFREQVQAPLAELPGPARSPAARLLLGWSLAGLLFGGVGLGGAWPVVLWFTMQGLLLAAERAWHARQGARPPRAGTEAAWIGMLRSVAVFHVVALSLVLVRAPDLTRAFELLGALVQPSVDAVEPSVAVFVVPAMVVAVIALSRLGGRWAALARGPCGLFVAALLAALVGLAGGLAGA
jgi:alginate O-acetyltransferase complex protein AlgI